MVRICHLLRKLCFIMKYINQEKVNCFCQRVIMCWYSMFKSNRIGINCEVIRSRELVVSLTTIPNRIHLVWLTIESILRQTYKPDKIVLWLAEDEFKDIVLPKKLLKQKRRGLEIRYCENLKSHKKYCAAMEQFPKALLVTIDDDILYSERLLENLVRAYVRHPNCIIACRAHLVKYDHRRPVCYNDWIFHYTWNQFFAAPKDLSRESIFFTSGAGTLIPVWRMPKICTDKELSMTLCPTADDVWLNYMARIADIDIIPLRTVDGWFIYLEDVQDLSLSKVNLGKSEWNNDGQLQKMYEHFGFYV